MKVSLTSFLIDTLEQRKLHQDAQGPSAAMLPGHHTLETGLMAIELYTVVKASSPWDMATTEVEDGNWLIDIRYSKRVHRQVLPKSPVNLAPSEHNITAPATRSNRHEGCMLGIKDQGTVGSLIKNLRGSIVERRDRGGEFKNAAVVVPGAFFFRG